MITTINSLSKRFYFYQKLRFPVIVLSLSLLPAILSSGTIVTANPPLFQVAGVLISSILYLLHIRVIDEYRDFSHDNIRHNLRPIQTGHISIKELQIIDIYAMVIFLAIAIFAGSYSFLVGVFMCDAGCDNYSLRGDWHNKASDYQFPVLAVGLIIFAISIIGNKKLRILTPIILALGMVTLYLAHLLFAPPPPLPNVGILQRAAIGLPYVIVMVIAIRLFIVQRSNSS